MTPLYRVDKFAVPEAAREEFWRHVRRTHALLREQPGFLDDVLLEQRSGPGRFNVVTLVRWRSADDLAAARPVVEASHRAAGFSPAAFFERTGVEADLADYVEAGTPVTAADTGAVPST
ncbi:antibiotic biosynthesis monooxygenase family protein [Streptomyces sp. bgisy022]|uniref:antibiotic biosynthesis monooxygenase family protein n=1 Tax=Streptomyces sp. bgisy022 TaxID=3413769 RepID=UPI003D72EF13